MLEPVERPGDGGRGADLGRDHHEVLRGDRAAPELTEERLERVARLERPRAARRNVPLASEQVARFDEPELADVARDGGLGDDAAGRFERVEQLLLRPEPHPFDEGGDEPLTLRLRERWIVVHTTSILYAAAPAFQGGEGWVIYDAEMSETQLHHSPNGVVGAPREVVDQAETAAKATSEDVKQQLRTLGIGAGFGAGAAVLAVYGVGFALATLAVVLATFLPWWLSVLIVTLVIFGATAILGLLARRQFEKGTPIVPENLIDETQRQRLLWAVTDLRREFAKTAKARAKIPAAAAATGFVLGGGLRAIVRLVRR